jgi:hypothetical protein
VALLVELAGRRDALAQPLDRHATGRGAHVEREARVDPAVALAHVRHRRQRVAGRHALVHGRDRGGEVAAAVQARCRRGDHLRAAGRPADDLEELHRGDREPEARFEAQLAGVGGHSLDLEPALGRPATQLVEQLRVAVHGGHRVTVGGQVERQAAGAGAQLEHRAADPVGQLAPEREVDRVRAALHVVPDHRVAQSDHRLARPRRASTSRSSSSAV